MLNQASRILRFGAGAVILAALASTAMAAQDAAAAKTSATPAYPLKLSANHRYLVDQAGKPFLIVGDTPQGLIGRLSEKDAEYYFADREAHGFNTLGWMDVECAGRDYPTNTNATTPDGIKPFTGYVAGGTDFEHYDLSTPNEAYFERLDHILQLATNHHLLIFLDPMETIGWLPTLRNNGIDSAYAYGQFLGKRYLSFKNLMWISGNDFDLWTEPHDDDLAQAVAKGIRSVAPEQMQTVELNVRTSSSFDDPRWALMSDLNASYTYSPTYIQVLHSYNQKPVAPDFLVEAHYDLERVGDPIDFGSPLILRKQDYWTMLSGGVGQFYGNGFSWSFREGWKDQIDTPGVQQLGIWARFFSSLRWQDLVPDQAHAVVTGGLGTYGNVETKVSVSDYLTAARSHDGSLVVAYMPTSRTITVNMGSLSGPARGRWFDPSNGSYQDAAPGVLDNSGSRQFTPPGKNHDGDGDWVLLLEASGASH